MGKKNARKNEYEKASNLTVSPSKMAPFGRIGKNVGSIVMASISIVAAAYTFYSYRDGKWAIQHNVVDAAPVISINAASVEYRHQEKDGENRGLSKDVYIVRLKLKNSGGRDAEPVWVAVAPESQDGVDWGPNATETALVQKGGDQDVVFRIFKKIDLAKLRRVIVGIGFADSYPIYPHGFSIGSLWGDVSKDYRWECPPERVFALNAMSADGKADVKKVDLMLGVEWTGSVTDSLAKSNVMEEIDSLRKDNRNCNKNNK